MRFKDWIESAQFNPYGNTVIIPPENMGMTNNTATDTTVPYQHPNQKRTPSNTTISKIEQTLKTLEAPDDKGYSGTPDFSAPEQFFASTNQPDHYHVFLKGIPEMFPDQANLAKKIMNNWMLFKSEIMRKMGRRQYMTKDNYPIHYKVLLDPLMNATKSFEQIKSLLSQDNDPRLKNLKKLFSQLYSQHSALRQSIEQPLTQWLNQSRENPFEPHQRTAQVAAGAA